MNFLKCSQIIYRRCIELRLQIPTFTQTLEHCFYLLLYEIRTVPFPVSNGCGFLILGLLYQFLFFVLYCDVSSFVVMETGVLFPFRLAPKLQIIFKRNPVLSSFKICIGFRIHIPIHKYKLHLILLC